MAHSNKVNDPTLYFQREDFQGHCSQVKGKNNVFDQTEPSYNAYITIILKFDEHQSLVYCNQNIILSLMNISHWFTVTKRLHIILKFDEYRSFVHCNQKLLIGDKFSSTDRCTNKLNSVYSPQLICRGCKKPWLKYDLCFTFNMILKQSRIKIQVFKQTMDQHNNSK